MESTDWALWMLGYIMVLMILAIALIDNEDFTMYESVSILILWPLSLTILTLMFFPKAIQKMSRELLPRSRDADSRH